MGLFALGFTCSFKPHPIPVPATAAEPKINKQNAGSAKIVRRPVKDFRGMVIFIDLSKIMLKRTALRFYRTLALDT
jgi:hypothetical protein